MTFTSANLKAFVNASASDDDFIDNCFERATKLVEKYIGTDNTTVPEKVKEGAILEVGGELFARKQAPSGIAQFATTDGAPQRLTRDPMLRVYPMLDPFKGGGFA